MVCLNENMVKVWYWTESDTYRVIQRIFQPLTKRQKINPSHHFHFHRHQSPLRQKFCWSSSTFNFTLTKLVRPTSASRIVVVNPLAKISSLKFSRARSQSFRVGISQNSNLSATTTVLHRPPWQIVPLLSAIKTGRSTCNQNRLGHCNDLLQSEKKNQKKSISGGFHNPSSIGIASAQNVRTTRMLQDI